MQDRAPAPAAGAATRKAERARETPSGDAVLSDVGRECCGEAPERRTKEPDPQVIRPIPMPAVFRPPRHLPVKARLGPTLYLQCKSLEINELTSRLRNGPHRAMPVSKQEVSKSSSRKSREAEPAGRGPGGGPPAQRMKAQKRVDRPGTTCGVPGHSESGVVYSRPLAEPRPAPPASADPFRRVGARRSGIRCRGVNSGGECHLHTVEVEGSHPSRPTSLRLKGR